PSELQPLTGKQMRQAVRNGGATLVLINSVPIRLREQAKVFLHVRPGTEDAIVLALANSSNDSIAAQKAGIEASAIDVARQAIANTEGDVVIMFGHELSNAAQAVVAQLSQSLGGDKRRILLHPLPFFNNSVGAHAVGMMDAQTSPGGILNAAGGVIRALYMAG